MQTIDFAAQTIYSDLLSQRSAADGSNLSFTTKKVKGNDYWYLNAKIGKTPVQRYIGPDNDETLALIDQEKALWESRQDEKKNRARLVEMCLKGGFLALTPQEGKVLTLFEQAGVFLTGGIIVGTPAFRLIGNNLGVAWPSAHMTRDLDLASDFRVPLVLENKPIDLSASLRESELGFFEIPAFNRKHPSTSYSIRGQEFVVDLLTPEIGKPSTAPVYLKAFNTYAHPLRFLDYLIEEAEPAIGLFGFGILLNVPNPARFAFHKLVVSQRRRPDEALKSNKDIEQATAVLEVICTQRPGAVIAAYEAAMENGGKLSQYVKKGIKLVRSDVQSLVSELVDS